MNAIRARLEGKKTYIGITVACVYSVATYLGVTESSDMVWTAILAWTGVSLRLAMR